MPTERLEAVGWLVGERSVPISRACRALNLGCSCYYRPQRNQAEHDAPVIARLNEVVGKHGRWGFWKCFHWMRLKGETWNHKRIWRVYRTMKLNLPRAGLAMIIVSHSANYIKKHCDSAAVLLRGQLHHFDSVDDAFGFYQENNSTN